MPKSPIPHAVLHAPGGVDDILLYGGNTTTGAVETLPRVYQNGKQTPAAAVTLMYFTSPVTITITQFSICIATTAFTWGTTGGTMHSQLGLFTVGANGVDATLVAATIDLTNTVWTATGIATNAMSASAFGGAPTSYQLLRNTRYAVGVFLNVGTGGTPVIGTFAGNATSAALLGISPRASSTITATTAIPTGTTTSFGTTSNYFWMELS